MIESVAILATFVGALYCAYIGCRQDAQQDAAMPVSGIVNVTRPTILVEEDGPPTYGELTPPIIEEDEPPSYNTVQKSVFASADIFADSVRNAH